MITEITESVLLNEILEVNYSYPSDTLVHCTITVKNGFVFTGESGYMGKGDFDRELAKDYAYNQAFDKMWLPYHFWLKQSQLQGSYIEELQQEYQELSEKNAQYVLFPDDYNFLADDELKLLDKYMDIQQQYLTILNERIELAKTKQG